MVFILDEKIMVSGIINCFSAVNHGLWYLDEIGYLPNVNIDDAV